VIDVLEEVEELPDIIPPASSSHHVTPSQTNNRLSLSKTNRRSKPYSRPSKNASSTLANTSSAKTSDRNFDCFLLQRNLNILKSQYSEKAKMSASYENSSLDTTFAELIGHLEMASSLHRMAMDKLASLQRADEIKQAEESENRLRRTIEIQKEELRQELETCVICYTEKKNVVLVPCGHTFCNTCALRMGERCGFCREMVHDVVRMQFTS
jgi:predicted O-linked N-acetylglucosamine transferase (SPINDLY family)